MLFRTLFVPVASFLLLTASPWATAFPPVIPARTGTRLSPASTGLQSVSSSSYLHSLTHNQKPADVTHGTEDAVSQPPLPPPQRNGIQSLTSRRQFLDTIDRAPTDSLVAIEFYGQSCPLCKRVAPKYQKLARRYRTAPIVFCTVERRVHPDLFQTLGVAAFPHLQIYRNRRCVASHGTESAASFERIVGDTIHQFLVMTGEDWNSFLAAFDEKIRQATDKLDQVRALP